MMLDVAVHPTADQPSLVYDGQRLVAFVNVREGTEGDAALTALVAASLEVAPSTITVHAGPSPFSKVIDIDAPSEDLRARVDALAKLSDREPRAAPESAYVKLERSLRRLVRLRELGAAPEIVEREIALSRRWWRAVPVTPRGSHLVWPDDVRDVARELGFSPDTREAGPLDPELGAGIAAAASLQRVVAAIARAIEDGGGVADVHVVATSSTIVLRGLAADGTVRDRASAIAAQLAPGATIRNEIGVRGDLPSSC